MVIVALILITATRGGDSGEPADTTSATPTARATRITPARTAEPAATQMTGPPSRVHRL